MKPIIQELRKKAVVDRPVDYLTSSGKIAFTDTERGVDLNLFAELIIRECIDVLGKSVYLAIREDGEQEHIDVVLLEHFGVEE